MTQSSTVRIATRRSPLAVWQANHLADLLVRAEPGLAVELVSIDTAADLDLSRTIDEIGGKGAFTKEVQALVLAGHADLAVHSAKDMPAAIPPGLTIGAYPERGTEHDCLVGTRLTDLGAGSVVATGSNRRRALLLDRCPEVEVIGLRGNIGTRLARLADPGIDAVVMAAVALERLGEQLDVVDDLDPGTFVPQVGQGALAAECRADDDRLLELLAAVDHGPTRTVVEAERSFLAELGGDCDLPAGANGALSSDGKLTIRGILAVGDDEHLARAEVVDVPSADPGRSLARRLRR